MNDWQRVMQQAEYYKKTFAPGTRIMLINMNDPYSPVPSGTRGTVVHVDDMGTLHMNWDNGRTLGVVPGEDSFRKLTQQELDEEASKNGSLEEHIKKAEKDRTPTNNKKASNKEHDIERD